MADGLPADVIRFLDRYIPSLGQLEALLLLRRRAPQPATVEEIAKQLYFTPEVAAAQLAELQRHGLLAAEPAELGLRYAPPDAEADRLIGEVARIYEERRVTVITQIYSKPGNNVRTFADSFRLRKNPDEKNPP
jgi:hypothetical protein